MYIQRISLFGQSNLIFCCTVMYIPEWVGYFFKSSEEKTQTHSSFLFECSTKYLCILQNNVKPWILISLVLILMLKSMALSNVYQSNEILTCFMVHIIQE